MRVGGINIVDADSHVGAFLCPWCGEGLAAMAEALKADRALAEKMGLVTDDEGDDGDVSEFATFGLCASCRRTWQGRALRAMDLCIGVPLRGLSRLLWRGKRALLSFVGGDHYRTIPVAHTDLYCRRMARGEARQAGYLRRLFRAAFTCRRFGHLIDGTEMGSGGGGVDGWCARCDCNVLLSASAVRWLREGGSAPELFATWDRLGLTPERPRVVEESSEEPKPLEV